MRNLCVRVRAPLLIQEPRHYAIRKLGKMLLLSEYTPLELKEFPNKLNKKNIFISHGVLIRPFSKNVFPRTEFRVIMTSAHVHKFGLQ